MYITLRPVDPASDFPRLAEIASAANGEPATAEGMQKADANRPEGTILRRMAAIDEAGRICGYYIAQRYPWANAGEFFNRTMVDPASQRQGVGTALADDALRFVRSEGGTALVTMVKDDSLDSRRFAEARGFVIKRHLFQSRLDLDAFADARFASAVATAEAQGIRFTTLADLGATEANIHRLYDLDNLTSQDIPGREGEADVPFEDFLRFVSSSDWFRPEANLIALDGDLWVGMAAMSYRKDGETPFLYHNMTGVLRSHRGRGIAQALKVLGVQVARRMGVTYLKTDNDETNAPMLAINRKMGFRPLPGTYFLQATLQ